MCIYVHESFKKFEAIPEGGTITEHFSGGNTLPLPDMQISQQLEKTRWPYPVEKKSPHKKENNTQKEKKQEKDPKIKNKAKLPHKK